jgi:hypothetical protein
MLLCLTIASAQTTPPMEGVHPLPAPVGMQRGGASCDTISFTGLASNVAVTDQYQSCGVVFENSATYDYGSGSYGSVLHSTDWFDSLVVRFVEPDDAMTPRPVQYLSFGNLIDPNVSAETDYISVRVYDAAGNLLHWESNTSASRVDLDLGAPIIARVVVDDSLSTAYILDDFVFSGTSTSGLHELAGDAGLSVYPDPFQDGIQVRTGVGCRGLRVMDLAGHVLAIPAPRSEGTLWRLDLRMLAPGVYLLQVDEADGPRAVRIVKS